MLQSTRREFGAIVVAGFVPSLLQGGATRRFSYVHLDVFTTRSFEGNQLLVFLQPRGLDEAQMHTLTRESNLSECTFVFPPELVGTDHRVRIFTRNGETPFAGHPTIGTAFALAHAGVIKAGTVRTVFGLGVGPTPIDLDWNGSSLRFAWMTQLNPTFGKTVTDTAALASALGLEPAALAEQRAPAQEVNCGSNFFVVPVATRKAVDSAAIDRAKVDAVFAAAGIQRRGIYIFSTEGSDPGSGRGSDPGSDPVAYSRLLPGGGGIEDPATGSAAGPAGCFIAKYGFVPAARVNAIVFQQGVLVRRPSLIHVNVTMTGGEITRVKVGGPAVVVGEGTVTVP
jgi:trans-2,3-dihydro-3-hydroxyanthranilate isomerase